jgi:hypothetical protein
VVRLEAMRLPPPLMPHARRPALYEIREFRKAMPRPRRGSELVSGMDSAAARGLPQAKSSWRCSHTHTHTTTGGPHVGRIYICTTYGLATWSLVRSSLLRRDAAFSRSFLLHQARGRVATTGHQGSQYLLQGKQEGILVQCISNKAPCYLLTF